MTNEKKFRDELLRQNGLQTDVLSVEDREALRRILKRDKARARRMKWLTGITWALVLASVVGGSLLDQSHIGRGVEGYFFLSRSQVVFQVGIVLFYPLAIVCTISFAIRSWIARNREFHFHVTEIEARLQSIEEVVKHLATRD